jgi:hypothetical protein
MILTVFQGWNNIATHTLQQLCLSVRGALFPRGSRGVHRASILAFNVDVLYIWRAGRHDANYVVNWKLKPNNFWASIVWCALDQNRGFFTMEMVYGFGSPLPF